MRIYQLKLNSLNKHLKLYISTLKSNTLDDTYIEYSHYIKWARITLSNKFCKPPFMVGNIIGTKQRGPLFHSESTTILSQCPKLRFYVQLNLVVLKKKKKEFFFRFICGLSERGSVDSNSSIRLSLKLYE